MTHDPNNPVSAYLADIGKRGGGKTSDRKKAASAENGKKGGRPRKVRTDMETTNTPTRTHRYTLHYQYAAPNACGGNSRFEEAVRAVERDNQDLLARAATGHVEDIEIAETVFKAGGWADGDSVSDDILDLAWEVTPTT